MKQLLLLITIHFIIFHQREKDKHEKVFVALEKKNLSGMSPVKNWNFHLDLEKNNYGFLTTRPISDHLMGYHFLNPR
jgi:hypothetical protein